MTRTPEIDGWFEERQHPLDAAMRRARDIILAADDRVREGATPDGQFRLGEATVPFPPGELGHGWEQIPGGVLAGPLAASDILGSGCGNCGPD